MDGVVENKLDDLEKRISHQENIHKEVEEDPNLVHGVVKNTVVILISSFAITCFAVAIFINVKQ